MDHCFWSQGNENEWRQELGERGILYMTHIDRRGWARRGSQYLKFSPRRGLGILMGQVQDLSFFEVDDIFFSRTHQV